MSILVGDHVAVTGGWGVSSVPFPRRPNRRKWQISLSRVPRRVDGTGSVDTAAGFDADNHVTSQKYQTVTTIIKHFGTALCSVHGTTVA